MEITNPVIFKPKELHYELSTERVTTFFKSFVPFRSFLKTTPSPTRNPLLKYAQNVVPCIFVFIFPHYKVLPLVSLFLSSPITKFFPLYLCFYLPPVQSFAPFIFVFILSQYKVLSLVSLFLISPSTKFCPFIFVFISS